MAKSKDVRVTVILECTSCARNVINKESTGISRYITQKNTLNLTDERKDIIIVLRD